MKKTAIVLIAFIFASLSITSCQKAKEPEGEKEVQTQKQDVQAQKEEVKQQPSETKIENKMPQQQPSETKPEVPPKQQEQPTTTSEIKEEKKEKPVEAKPSPLTEKEQKQFEKLKKKWLSPKFTEEDALKALKILVKADLDPINVRWYQKSGGIEPGSPEPIDDVCDTISWSARTKKKEAFELTLSVLEVEKSYLYMKVCAAQQLKWFQNKEAIPHLRKYLNYTPYDEQLAGLARTLRLEAAGSLLALGDADSALPALEDLASEGATTALGYIFHHMEGQNWQKQGLEIIKRSYSYEINIKDNKKALESKVLAALFLIRLNEEVDKKVIENTLITIAEGIVQKPKWDVPSQKYSDYRILETIIVAFKELGTKRAIPLLKRIAEHPEASYITRRANEAIKDSSE